MAIKSSTPKLLSFILIFTFCVLGAFAGHKQVDLSLLNAKENFALILMQNQDVAAANLARDFVNDQGGRIAILAPPHVMMGWIRPDVGGSLIGLFGIEKVAYQPLALDSTPYQDPQSRAAISFFNAFSSGVLEADKEKAAYQEIEIRKPLINDALTPPPLNFNDYSKNLPWGVAPAPGNSDAMTGTVAVCLFFVESNGTIDPNTYTWASADVTNTYNRALNGLTWWANKAALEGYTLTFSVISYAPTSGAAQEGYEPILHSSSQDTLWINAIMANLGYTSGTKFDRLTAFNTWLRTSYVTDWSYSAFIGYNPTGASSTFTDGYFAYAYIGGPYTQLLFRNNGWGESNFGLVLSHESGHIFYACDEYYQAGYGGCTSCGACYPSGPRPYVPNANCEYCNASAVSCMMRNNADALCRYTKYQIGWLPSPYESANVNNFFVPQGQTSSVTFTVTNSKTYTEGGYLNISVSSGLEIVEADGLTINPAAYSNQSQGGITYVNYPVGYTLSRCTSGTITSTYQSMDIYAPYTTAQARNIVVKFRAKIGAGASQWVDHKAAFYVPNNYFIRDPLSGSTDQQACYVRVINVTVGAGGETVSTPTKPSGREDGATSTSYEYTTGASTSSSGHSVQYFYDWGDATDSGWLPVGIVKASKAWSTPGIYSVRAKARCSIDIAVESAWSAVLSVDIKTSATNCEILPEAIWADATGGGTWVTDIQVTDVTGGSVVSVYFDYGGGSWRGPFTLWTSPGPNASVKFSNILSTIDALDPEAFTYFGRVGAIEFWTQDASHSIQVSARTMNGNYSKTFPGLLDVEANSASISRQMMIQNLTSNAAYRTTVGCFNPSGSSVTAEFRLMDAAGSQIGSSFSKILVGYDFQVFSPFTEVGAPYPSYSHDNVFLLINPTSGAGRVMSFGATASNLSNDPAAHLAFQVPPGYDNSPGNYKILPEAIWAYATGGGTWITDIQVTDVTGGSVVTVTLNYGGGNRRGPFTLWTGAGSNQSVKFSNILSTIDGLDSEAFTYFGNVGAIEFSTQDASHLIHVSARTMNGNNSKTFPGLSDVDANTATTSRPMMIQNLTSNAIYRSTTGCFNPSSSPLTVEFRLFDANGSQIGSSFSKTFIGDDFQAFFPFTEAGASRGSYDNVFLLINPTSGTGRLMSFGATANNLSNDPAAHLAVRYQ